MRLLARRINRRDVLVGGSLLAVGSTVGCSGPEVDITPSLPVSTGFVPIAGSTEDRVVLPNGFTADVVIRWGDPVVAGSGGMPMDEIAAGAVFEPGAAMSQTGAFGANCDGMGVIPIDDDRLAV
jgi:secreted PhoX family phosphatase